MVTRSRGVITTLGDRHDALEVDVFGEPSKVRAAGFSDLNHGPACTSGNRVALRWVGNVRAVVNCDLVHDGERRYVARVARALARLRNDA